jgi:uncharacterized protein
MPLETYWSGLALVVLLSISTWLILVARNRRQSVQPKEIPARPVRALTYICRLVGFTFFIILLLAGGLLLFVNYQTMRSDLAPSPSQVDIPLDLPFQVEEITFAGGDDLELAGWYVPPANGATIILLHGYGGNRLGMLWHARVLVDAGYGVLLYDERASGESEGGRRSYGWEDASDVGGALDFLNSHTPDEKNRIGIAGCSIGGQIALQGAANYPQIAAVWADGPSAIRAKDIPIYSWQSLIGYISTNILDQMYIWIGGIKPPAAMVDIIGTIEPRPIMLVAGGSPHPSFGAEYLHIEPYLRYAGQDTDLWVIEEAIHCDGPIQRPDEYAQRMVEFFNESLGIAR